MKRSRVFVGVFLSVLVIESLHATNLSPSGLCWGAQGTGAATIEQISQHLKAKGVRMPQEKLNLVAQTVYEESLRYEVDYRLVLAVMKVESDYRQHAVSPDGSRGLMQIHPSLDRGLAKEAGIPYDGLKDLFNVQKNIRLGTHYLSKVIEIFDDIPKALFAYSVGHHKAKRLLASDRTPHTGYTKRVIAEYKRNTEKMVSL